MSKENNKPLHRPNGQFAPGHPKVGGSKKGKSLRQYRDVMMQQVSPFLENLGTIIGQIEAPEDKVLAISRVLKSKRVNITAAQPPTASSKNS